MTDPRPVATDDLALSDWEHRQRRRNLVTGLLAAAFGISVLVNGLLVYAVSDLGAVLHARSPVIERIDRSEARTACIERIEASFLASVGELLDAAFSDTEDDEATAVTLARLQLTTAALTSLAEQGVDIDPCAIPLPPPEQP